MFALVLEPQTAAWFKVQPGSTFVDIGAHIGRYTLMAARYASKVIAIEPEPSNFSLLRENVALNGFSNVVTLQPALSMDQRRSQFYVARIGDTATSSLNPEWRLHIPGHRRAGKLSAVPGCRYDLTVLRIDMSEPLSGTAWES